MSPGHDDNRYALLNKNQRSTRALSWYINCNFNKIVVVVLPLYIILL